MQMQLASRLAFPELLLAAMPQLSEKPRMGVRSKNQAWHPGFNVCNSTAAIGLQFRCSGIVSGPVVAPNSVINQAVQKFTVCLNTPGKAGWLATLGAIIGLQPDMPERPEGLNAQMGVSPSDGQVAPDPLMEQSLGASPGELGYNISAEKQCAKENPYVFLSPNVTLDILPGDVF
jgi:hypothetical protein